MTTTGAKLIQSNEGCVLLADGIRRAAYRNTYRGTVFSADGTFSAVEDVRIEFLLFTAAGRPRRWRKATDKQAATFTDRLREGGPR